MSQRKGGGNISKLEETKISVFAMEIFSIQEGRRKTNSGSTEEARREQTGEDIDFGRIITWKHTEDLGRGYIKWEFWALQCFLNLHAIVFLSFMDLSENLCESSLEFQAS